MGEFGICAMVCNGVEDNFFELLLSFNHIGPGDRIHIIIKFGGKCVLPTEPSC